MQCGGTFRGPRQTSSERCSDGRLVAGGFFFRMRDIVGDYPRPEFGSRKGMTWAWRPVNEPEAGSVPRGGNPCIAGRDYAGGAGAAAAGTSQRLESNRDWNTEANPTR